jgi:IS30 family transposase
MTDAPAIAKRREFGHWEGDSIVGYQHLSGLHTEYERVSSCIRSMRMQRITTEEFVHAATKIFSQLPAHDRRSTTLDNGTEHTQHMHLHVLGVQTYPYAPWQRGGNENANLWIRYYFPKKTDFSTLTEEELQDVEWELNNRPRKHLRFRPPEEVFDHLLLPPH